MPYSGKKIRVFVFRSSFFDLRSSVFGLRFVDLGGLFYKTKTPVNFTSVCAEERFGLVF